MRAQTAGSLDTMFGTGGKVITPIGNSNDGISGVAIQTDGKIVAAGYADNGTNSDFALARYNTDGTLDTTFGTGGKTTTPIGSSNDFASSIAIQTGGKIIVAGYASNGANLDFALARYNTDGTLDTAFGTNGKVITPIGSLDDYASSIAIQTDGKIIVAGSSEISVFVNDFALARYNTDGTLDTTFGTGGKVVTPIGSSDDFASSVAIQSDGKIIVAGTASDGITGDFAAVRYNSNGTLDTTFGTGGKVVTPIGSSDDFASSVVIQTDGKIIVAGDTNNGNVDFALVRYNSNGTLDTTFGTGGKVVTPIGSANDFLYAATIQANGKIVVAGYTTETTDDFALARYNTDGTLDTTFGTGGKVVTPIGNLSDSANAIAIQTDGKIIAAGAVYSGTNYDFGLARYFGANPNNPVPTVSNLSPNNRIAGGGAFELTVNGMNFIANSVVRWNGEDRTTTFVSATQLKAQILASDVQAPGQYPVTVFNPAPGGGVSNAVNFTVAACSYSLTPTSQTFTAAGGSSSTALTTQTGCAYTAVSNSPFITVTTSNNGSGSGTITFTVAANTGPARTGTITIGGQTFTVNQAGGCTYGISPTSGNYSAAGETGSFTVTSSNVGCTYTATSNASFITITNGSGTGGGTVTFTVAANTGIARTGTITVNGQTFTVNQADGCTYSLSPTSANFAANGGTGSFNVTTGAGCIYTATSDASFIIINSGNTASGNGTVNFTVQSNTSTQRSGTITVNGQIFTVNQTAGTTVARTPFDFDGDGKADISVYRPDNGVWYLLNSQTGFTGAQFGIATDKIVPADYDGDGKTDIAVYRDGAWYLQRTSQGFIGISFGTVTDIPTPADFDGDGKAELAVFRPSNGTWYIYNLATNQPSGAQFGASEDKPVPGDYDGDGKDDIGVFRPSNGTWYFQRSSAGFIGIQFGISEDKPVPAKFDDGTTTDLGVFRPSTGTWYVRRAESNVMILTTAFGLGTDLPVPADYDGDGKSDVAVFRDGTWYIQRSTQGFTGVSFGQATDKPAPNAFVR